jgi:hypothetical protein
MIDLPDAVPLALAGTSFALGARHGSTGTTSPPSPT